MSIGEALARARRDAGLSISEISIRTSIEPSVIDDVERDDYSDCGGDAEARDTIAAIAHALHIDSGPLVDAFDAERRPGELIAAAMPSEPISTDDDTEPIAMGEPSESVTDGEAPNSAPISEPAHPVPISEPAHPIRIREPPPPITAGDPSPIIPAEASRRVRLTFADRHQSLWLMLGAVLLAVALLGSILLIFGASGRAARHTSAAGRHRTGGSGATHHAAAHPSPGYPARSPAPTRSASPAIKPARTLVPASIAAFGPGGTGQGDSPQLAQQALAGKAAVPWHSAWYATAHFGNLQSGTGLLLDMGRTVSITSARIATGNTTGTDLALRIGNTPTLASLTAAAHANDVGGVIRLTTAPTPGRYVLVWFTKLPPDQAGTFQVAVYGITLRGYP